MNNSQQSQLDQEEGEEKVLRKWKATPFFKSAGQVFFFFFFPLAHITTTSL